MGVKVLRRLSSSKPPNDGSHGNLVPSKGQIQNGVI